MSSHASLLGPVDHKPARSHDRNLVLVVLVAAVAATFGDALFSSRIFFARDIASYWYPGMAAFRRAIAEGSWPLWNPWLGFGAPLLADATFQLAYPPTWLTLALPLSAYLKLFVVGHCFFAACGALALARRLGLGWTASGVAAAAYGLSGPLVSAASLFHHYAGAAWLPWVLFALERLVRRPSLSSGVWLGVAAGGMLLAGSGDMCLTAGILGVARLAWLLARERPVLGRALTLFRFGALAALLAGSLGAVQWLPIAERAREGFRGRQDVRTSTYWSLHPASLVDVAIPRLVLDLPVNDAWRIELFEGRQPFIACPYLGVVAVVLAVLGLALGSRIGRLAGGGFLFFILAALGRHTPAYHLLFALPGFGLMRYPQKFLLPAAFCMALMAAAGADGWTRPWSSADRRRGRTLALLLLTTATLAVGSAWWAFGPPAGAGNLLDPALARDTLDLDRRVAMLKVARTALLAAGLALPLWRRASREQVGLAPLVAVLGLGVVDLVLVGRGLNPVAPAELLDRRPAVVTLFQSERARLYAATERPRCLDPARGPSGWAPSWVAALGFQETLRPPSGARWGLRGSYDGEFTGLGSRWGAAVTIAAWTYEGMPAGLRLLQLGGVTHVLRLGESPVLGLDLVEVRSAPCACPLQIFRVPDPLPEAYVVRNERAATDPDEVVQVLFDPAFDPRRDVVLADAQPSSGSVVPTTGDEVQVVSRRVNSMEIVARLAAPGVLVVLEGMEPGWVGSVDGAPVPVLRANGLFRAVRLPEGQHQVRLEYRPPVAAWGATISALGLAAVVGLGLVVRRMQSQASGLR